MGPCSSFRSASPGDSFRNVGVLVAACWHTRRGGRRARCLADTGITKAPSVQDSSGRLAFCVETLLPHLRAILVKVGGAALRPSIVRSGHYALGGLRQVGVKPRAARGVRKRMLGRSRPNVLSRLRHGAFATLLFAAALCLALLQSNAPAVAKGPESLADVAEGLQETVVNISTTQNLEDEDDDPPGRKAPGSSPFDELFDDFFSEEGA